jgi:Ser/Thr protein kinase RdoA (MazF antagonist)
MERYIKELYRDSILYEAMDRYGISKDLIRPLDAFESFIYEYQRSSEAFIMRIGHSSRRNENLILGEVDWINTLADGGVPVARAVRSENGNLVESIQDGQGGYFLATAFVKARGQRPWETGWTPRRYQVYGRLLGSMHAVAVDYRPPNPAWKRPDWNDDLMEFVEHYLPASEVLAKEKYHTLVEHLLNLPKDCSSFGLIHQDAHESNLLMDEDGTLTLFDFDDCVYSWYINDIAIVLFYIAEGVKDPPTFTREFLTQFLQGYAQVYQLDPIWLREIPNFLKMREIELYAVINRDFDVNQIDNPWCARFMLNRKFRIEQDLPVIDFDFESLSGILRAPG